jgi:DNA polymerase kappa
MDNRSQSQSQSSKSQSQLASGNTTKAGLPTSFNEINLRIAEVSKDSRFTAAQERKNVELEVKIGEQRKKLGRALEQPILMSRAMKSVNNLMKEYEKEQVEQFERSEEYCWVCIDMDAFFASVECLDIPELKSVPMAVGSSAMLSTANYEARKYGVSAAMPGYIAMKLCPELKIVPLRYERYKEMSGKVAKILSQYDPNLSMWSLDEAFLKLRKGQVQVNSSFVDVVQRMREEVKEKTGLTCSAGIACNPLLAKLASNYRKPDGQFEIDRCDLKKMRSFLFDQPVRKLPGIGKVMSLTLEKVFGITKIGEMYEKRHLLPLLFKEKTVKSLVSKSIGHSSAEDDTEITSEFEQKSVSCERTFQPTTVDFGVILKEICDNLAEDVKDMGIIEIGRVGIKVKTADFRLFTRERTCKISSMDLIKDDVLMISKDLLSEFLKDCEIRLLGVKLSNLKYTPQEVQVQNKKRTILEDWLQRTSAKCPICSKVFKNENDLNEINGHIDDCLTKTTLKEIL